MAIERKGKKPKKRKGPINYHTVFGGPREDRYRPDKHPDFGADHDSPAALDNRTEPYGVRLAIGFAMLRGDD